LQSLSSKWNRIVICAIFFIILISFISLMCQ
jgi:hypothetical protein